ncbi:MAG: saccharopine dehydrogenase C-terminal domain-containing protein [Nitrososphaeria archaeon]
MKVLVLGYGLVGSVIVDDLVSSNLTSVVDVGDYNYEVVKILRGEKVEGFRIDVRDRSELIRLMRRYDLVVGALPGSLGFRVEEAAVDAGVNMVDISYMPEDPFQLDSRAKDAGVTIIPDCGVAPGLSNLLVGYGYSKFDDVRSIKIFVGGLPKRLVPPLDYVITWSSEDLIEEYTRTVRIVKDGVLSYVEPLTGVELVRFEGLGEFEAFYTDGLRTLVKTFGDKVVEMWEKTLRYPGHVEKILLLKRLGMLDRDPLDVDDFKVEPRKFLVRLLDKNLRIKEPDMLLLRIILNGVKDGSLLSKIFEVVDVYDEDKGLTALSRTTAYTATGIALLLGMGMISEKGVVPPEIIGLNEKYTKYVLKHLAEKNIHIKEINIIEKSLS